MEFHLLARCWGSKRKVWYPHTYSVRRKKELLCFTGCSSNVMQHVTSYFLWNDCSVCTRSTSKAGVLFILLSNHYWMSKNTDGSSENNAYLKTGVVWNWACIIQLLFCVWDVFKRQHTKKTALTGVRSVWSGFPVLPQDQASCMVRLAHLSWSVFHFLFTLSIYWQVSMETTGRGSG